MLLLCHPVRKGGTKYPLVVNSFAGPVTKDFEWRGLLQLGSLDSDLLMANAFTRPHLGTGNPVPACTEAS